MGPILAHALLHAVSTVTVANPVPTPPALSVHAMAIE